MNLRRTLLLAPVAGILTLALPEPARACGGTFCDGGTQMPVDQTGEDILFIRDGNQVEVHVRIQYEGEASRFAWLVPVQAVPEVSVGSEPLFAALSQATVPSWQTSREYECSDEDPSSEWSAGSLGSIAELDAGSEPPEVVYEAVVGSFEIVVLQGGSAAEVIDFLQANEYAQDPESEPILQEYLDEGFLFAAVKLVAGVGVEAIHPLTFRMTASEPCVPIRLTRIAAKQDMGIRAYFLGQERWAPTNYAHVVLNPLAYDWTSGDPSRYLELLSLAVDEAGGRAFATDYAGSSDVVATDAVYDLAWDETAFVGVEPIAAINLIDEQGLNRHPLIQPLLLQFIPPPDGIDATDFWNNIEQYADQIDLSAWDGPAFAAALAEQIIEPGLHAVDLIDAWPKLTRLNTTMSPIEMTLDPMFHGNPDLPDVAAQVTTASTVLCGGDEEYRVDVDGQPTVVCRPDGEGWPVIEGMPNALRIEHIPMAGPSQVTVDLTSGSLALLAAQQATVSCLSSMGDGDGDGDGGDELADDGSSTTTQGDPTYELPYDTTCGCAATPDQAPLAIGLGLLVLGLIAPRRRPS
jgi:MYXO-CTERM domain-containing protein